ncbi:MAG: bifunctional aconitate hydratase 2/2-methylisocitrate dehydratase [Planctomycetota bacterium]|jgi:aconitate hydratase 2/2-methylisocitrate dehydratase
MAGELERFAEEHAKTRKERKAQGIPPQPLSERSAEIITAALLTELADDGLPGLESDLPVSKALLYLLEHRISPGVYPSSKVKAAFLGSLLSGDKSSPYIDRQQALEMLGTMGGGDNVIHLINEIDNNTDLAPAAADTLGNLFLVSSEDIMRIEDLARSGKDAAVTLLEHWAEARWFANAPPVDPLQKRTVIRLTGEINTDFLSPAQEAGTRDDIPLHALKILSTSPGDTDFIERVQKLTAGGAKLLCVGDVVGTGSSRKSASNSLVWWIGEDIPFVPNKKRGGVLFASKIAPIFFNTMRGCGAIPVRCSTGSLQEGMNITIDFNEGRVLDDRGSALSEFKVEPASILDEARAGGRNNLIIGRKLTMKAREACSRLGIQPGESALALLESEAHPAGQKYTLAQKLVGNAAGSGGGVLPGEYCEPKAHLVYSQDTTGRMTQQELQELACLRLESPTIQSFCHTAAGPKSKDSTMQFELGAFIQQRGGIDLRPGDGVIHTNGNRFLLPYFVGTGGDSHTRFPIGLSFPAGSDLVAFAASQGYFPLDMPESVLVRYKGSPKPGITMRDLVNAIPFAALKTGQLNLEKGDAKTNVFADRVLEVQGLENVSVEEAYKITDTSAERSAAGSTFSFAPERIKEYVENNLKFLKNNFSKRHPAAVVGKLIEQFESWISDPQFMTADETADYADVVEVNLDGITEPLLAAPNDPDKIVTLSEAAGTHVDEVFVGSCMVDITDFRGVAAILEGTRLPHKMKMWTVPPDRESFSKLARAGILSLLAEAGANVHVPGCSLCMGNQAQVAANCTTLSTSTRNFNNRMGQGAQVYLGSSYLGAVTALLNRIPSVDEYMEIYEEKVLPREKEIMQPLAF